MTRDDRPDPDILLKAIHSEEAKDSKAKLRIFFGMSAGVGKTYAMLKAAQQKKAEGCNVLIGVVETHGRKETLALVDGLTVLPRKKITYKGTLLEEMDLDAILELKPQLVLVDELAHSNIPGSRHPKRYQDVLELLDAGIDVYSTVNVQHLESRKDSVERVTGIQIRETVPDSILERAQVEVVDIAPLELLKRLKEGKVYLGEKAERAAENFFKEDRLTALREMALRLTAERVDLDLQRFVEIQATGPWQTNERLMVAISHSPYSERLIRATRRLAFNLEAPWIAVYVDTGIHLNTDDQTQLTKNINLARELNAEIVTTVETDVPSALKRVARQKNITQMVVGRPTRRWVKDILEGGTLLDQLVRDSGDVDIHVIRQETQTKYSRPLFQNFRFKGGFIEYWYTLWLLLGVGFISGLIEPLVGYQAVGFIFLLAVLVVGLLGSTGNVLFAAALSMVGWNFFFIPPRLTFAIEQPEDFILCVTFFIVAVITGFLTNRIRVHEKIIREREDRTNVLFEISQDIAQSQNKTEFLQKIIRRVNILVNAECGILLKNIDGKLQDSFDKPYSISLNEKEFAVAIWAFEKNKAAGWSTDTLSESKALYLPLRGPSETVGVFVFQPKTIRKLSVEQENMLHSIVSQIAISLERHFFEKRLREGEKLKESEQLHQTLLNSISHEMRTPLTAILGSATALADKSTPKSLEYIEQVATQLMDAGDRLNRVIENLLDMSRLNSGVLALKLEWHDLNDLIGVTLQKLTKNLSGNKIKVENDGDALMAMLDFRLMEHALSNLILNAANYSPAGSEIRISGRVEKDRVLLSVEDEGNGIPQDSISKIFEKFYRIPGTLAGGTGLGLSIVKSIVEAHKGSVSVYNRPDKGACFTIDLPAKGVPSLPPEEK